MAKLVLRGFLQRKLRVLLTGIAIALGVALMAGTYVLTDTINHSFAGIFKTAAKGQDVVVSPSETLGREKQAQHRRSTTRCSRACARSRAWPKRRARSSRPAHFLDVKRKRLTSGGAPAFIAGELPKRFESFSPVKGRFPTSADEVAIDEATAERAGLKLGQQMIVAGAAPARRYTIVGIAQVRRRAVLRRRRHRAADAAEAQRAAGEVGRYDQIDVAAARASRRRSCGRAIRAALPDTVNVRTGAQQAAKNTSDLESNLGFLRTFLLIFAYVSLVVGAFIIFNTFSITVAQRTREFGLLRTLGASRAQIMRSVVDEGLLLGIGGAVLGLLGGIALAPALDQLFKAFGAELPDSGTVLETRTIVVSLLVGTIVTVLAGLAPALRATRVPPLAAMREGVEIEPRTLTGVGVLIRSVIAALLAVAIVALLGAGVGVILFVLLAVYVTRLLIRLIRGGASGHHRVVPALARAIGVLVTWRGITGRLARENAIRQPGRTMVTAAALTVGLALVAFVAVLADGTKATIDQSVSRSFAGSLIVENTQAGNEQGIPALVAPALRKVPGVASATPIAFTLGRVSGIKDNATITAIDPSSFERVYRVEWDKGSNATLLGLGSEGTILTKGYAKEHHIKVGQMLSVLTPANKHVALRVLGTVEEKSRLLLDLTISLPLARSAFGQGEDALDFLSYAPGYDNARVQPAVDRLLAADFPQARSRTAAQFKQDQAGQINTLLALIYVLLALSVIVSLFGIVNTLILSIYERTRELGMMRAIGTSRRQVRQMIRYESVITALIGGVFGLVIGIVGALLVVALALSGSGYVIAIPFGTLLVLLVVAALAGVLAAAAAGAARRSPEHAERALRRVGVAAAKLRAMAASATPGRATPSCRQTAWDLEPLVDGEGAAGVETRLAAALERAQAFAERYAGRLDELDSRRPAGGDGGARGDLRPRRPRRHLRRPALLHRHRRARQRRAAAGCAGARDGDRDDAAVLRARVGGAGGRARRAAARRRGPRLLPPSPAQRAPLPRAPALRAGGEDPRREVADRSRRVDASVRGADIGDRGGAAPGLGAGGWRERGRRDGRARRRPQPPVAARPRRRAATTAEAVTAALAPGLRTRAFLFNTLLADKGVDDRLRQLPALARRAQPRERGQRRVGAGADRGGPRPL